MQMYAYTLANPAGRRNRDSYFILKKETSIPVLTWILKAS